VRALGGSAAWHTITFGFCGGADYTAYQLHGQSVELSQSESRS
jgi:hypothetical protein